MRASQSKPVGNLEKKNCNVTRPRHWRLSHSPPRQNCKTLYVNLNHCSCWEINCLNLNLNIWPWLKGKFKTPLTLWDFRDVPIKGEHLVRKGEKKYLERTHHFSQFLPTSQIHTQTLHSPPHTHSNGNTNTNINTLMAHGLLRTDAPEIELW